MVYKKVAKAFDLLWIWILLFQNYHGLEEVIWLLHWKLFGDLHCRCFITCTITLNLIIPHFSLAHVFRVYGMNKRNVIEMMNERICHYYVLGLLLQSCHVLKAIWLLNWKLFGDLHCWFFLRGTMTLNLVTPHFSLANVLGRFFLICKIRPFLSIMYLRLLLQSYYDLRTFWGPTFVDTSWQAWLNLVIPHLSLVIMFMVCGTSNRHVKKMKNCVI